jgi:transcriptional regulator with XRE-family HTH domain
MFGAMLRKFRARALCTQEELAEQSGISARHIRQIEAGRVSTPRLSTIRILADALRLSPAEREIFHRAAQQPVPLEAVHSGQRKSPPAKVVFVFVVGGDEPSQARVCGG